MTTLTAIDQLHLVIPHLKDGGEGAWQSILDYLHEMWEDGDSYNQFLNKVEDAYGPLAKMAVLIAKYNYQVENGGHVQYFDNGYASKNTNGCFASHVEVDNHKDLIRLVNSHLDIPIKEELFRIMKDFNVDFECTDTCEDCDGTGEYEEEEEDEYGDITITRETCYSCSGSGEVNFGGGRVINGDNLDDRYYKINVEVVKQIDEFYTHIVNGESL